MTTSSTSAAEVIGHEMTRFESRLNSRLLRELETDFTDWQSRAIREDRRKDRHLPREARQRRRTELRKLEDRRTKNVSRDLLFFLRQQIELQLRSLYRLDEQQETLRRSLMAAVGDLAREDILLDHAELLGATPKQLDQDRKAFQRWFDDGAIIDRYNRRRGESEHRLTFCLERFANVLQQVAQTTGGEGLPGIWRRLNVDDLLLNVLEYAGDVRVRVAAVRCCEVCVSNAPSEIRCILLSDKIQVWLYDYATDGDLDVWLQCGALTVLARMMPKAVLPMLKTRLLSQDIDDDIFVRRHIVRTLVGLDSARTSPLFEIASHDKSVFVRQQVAAELWRLPLELALPILKQFVLEESHPQVVAAVLAEAPGHVDRSDLRSDWLRMLSICLAQHTDAFVLRTAIHVAVQWLDEYLASNQLLNDSTTSSDVVEAYQTAILPAMSRLETTSPSIPVRRWSAHARERIWCSLNPEARGLYAELDPMCDALKPGQSRRLSTGFVRKATLEQIARVLAVKTQDDYGYDIRIGLTGYWLIRQPCFGNRIWRILHELRTPATDKRQGFRHTIGRVSRATVRIPSQIMGELSQTKVPGEPLFNPSDGSWRPYLPLVDDFVSALNCSILWPRTTHFYTSQGVTRIRPAGSILKRLHAWYALSWGFESYASLRDWNDTDNVAANTYLGKFKQLGFEVDFEPHKNVQHSGVRHEGAQHDDVQQGDAQHEALIQDHSVLQYFACLAVVPGMQVLDTAQNYWERYATYFFSIFDNTLQHLLLFAILFAVFFLGRHLISNRRIEQGRRRLPLCLGGWGTRGKSGTERLKAALIGALGHGFISKTTGCEAMFIHANAFGDQLEVPLFRAFDKATIWEQANMLKLADEMKSSVFLWECMGLNPTNVDVLQRQWTQDDLATVTNTYPDHEDIQGPAGYNVACTIAGFAPRNAHVITTEQEMRPVVRQSCKEVRSTLRGVGWLESGLIPDEVLDRFPYREHPDNIALVAAMADELGVEYDFAVKAMADRLIPDLGVLKTYPVSEIRTRRIEFTNGMSANERFGCLGNWTRLGFDRANVYEKPDTWVSTVINNRADRVARSKVFASIVVNDVSADRHFLIGTNLKGLAGFISNELETMLAAKTLGENGAYCVETAKQKLIEAADWYRQPTLPEHVERQLEVMRLAKRESTATSPSLSASPSPLPSSDSDGHVHSTLDASITDSLEYHHSQLLAGLAEYQELHQAICAAGDDALAWKALDDRYRDLIRTWFNRKLVVIHDAGATGEQVIDQIVRSTPPGVKNRVMGMQNIKGTGLDFVYRFQDWDSCHTACEMLRHADTAIARKGLDALARLPVLGQLCQSHTLQAIQAASESSAFQSPEMRAALDEIRVKLNASTKAIGLACRGESDLGQKKSSAGLVDRLIAWLEEFLDVNDAIRRRTNADAIYEDLVNERISRQRAILEIRAINKRQKGGWLKASVTRRKEVRQDGSTSQNSIPREVRLSLRELWRSATASRNPT